MHAHTDGWWHGGSLKVTHISVYYKNKGETFLEQPSDEAWQRVSHLNPFKHSFPS